MDYTDTFKFFENDMYSFRLLQKDDMKLGFLETLESLTSVEEIDQKKLDNMWENILKNPILKNITIVAINKEKNRIVGTGSIYIQKHITGKVGHVENIAVSKSQQGRGLGRKILDILNRIGGYDEKVKQIHLFCKQNNVSFYQKLGYDLEDEEMFCRNWKK